MSKYLVKRILLAILSVFIICLITFFAMNAVPGGPFNSEKATSPAVKAVLMERYNLDKPVGQQFLIYMKNLIHLFILTAEFLYLDSACALPF